MRYDKLVVLGAALAFAVAAPLSAQRVPQRHGGPGARAAAPGLWTGGGIERVLQLREDLELTEQQIADLNAIRADHLERRQGATATMMQLRSDLGAGEITRSEMRDALAESRAAVGVEPGQVRDQIQQILTEEQVDALGRSTQHMRGSMRGQARGQRGGVRSGRGAPNARRRGRPGSQRGFQRSGGASFGRGFAPARGFRRPGQ